MPPGLKGGRSPATPLLLFSVRWAYRPPHASSGRGRLCLGTFDSGPDALFELCDALLAGSGLLGACALTRAGVPEKPRQPLQGARPWSDRRGSSPAAARCQPATELSRRLRRRRFDPRPLRCRDEPRARISLLGLQTLGRPADRGGMVLPCLLYTSPSPRD